MNLGSSWHGSPRLRPTARDHAALTVDAYPRSAAYDPAWSTRLDMGPHPPPFDDDTFDAIVSIDAFEYFGTDVRSLPALPASCGPAGESA